MSLIYLNVSQLNSVEEPFETIKDERGEIRKIAKNVDVLNIFTKKGFFRAAHYHKNSSHICKLLSGKMLYFERDHFKADIKPLRLEINTGDYFFSDKLVDHLMVFLEDSEFDCYSFGSRNKEDYENDLVRINYNLEEIYNSWKD